MSLFTIYLDGERVPFSQVKPGVTLKREADEFAHHPRGLHTGKAESQWVGAWLLHLAAQDGAWQAVPWRMLRNEYMRYGKIKRALLKDEKRLPKLPESEPVVVYTLGGDTPIEELLIGIKDLLDRKMAEIVTLEDEEFVIPTEALFTCVPEAFSFADAR